MFKQKLGIMQCALDVAGHTARNQANIWQIGTNTLALQYMSTSRPFGKFSVSQARMNRRFDHTG
jgi:hypothetical protein